MHRGWGKDCFPGILIFKTYFQGYRDFLVLFCLLYSQDHPFWGTSFAAQITLLFWDSGGSRGTCLQDGHCLHCVSITIYSCLWLLLSFQTALHLISPFFPCGMFHSYCALNNHKFEWFFTMDSKLTNNIVAQMSQKHQMSWKICPQWFSLCFLLPCSLLYVIRRQKFWDKPQMALVGRACREPNLSPWGWLKQTTGTGALGEPTYSPHFKPFIHDKGL